MEQEKKTRLIIAGVILLALVACGVIGYINRPVSGAGQTQDGTAAAGQIAYCTGSANPCVTSFGLDNTGNMLIVLVDTAQPPVDLYVKIGEGSAENLYPCQKVGFSADTFYCLGNPVADGSKVTLRLFSKADDRLLASGELQVEFSSTPVVVSTNTPAVTPTVVKLASATPTPNLTVPPPTTGPGYTNPGPGTVYPNPPSNRVYP